MTNPTIQTFAEALGCLEDGQLVADLTTAQQKLLAALNNAVLDGAKKAKGKMTLVLDYELEGGTVEIKSDIKTVEPKTARARTILWTDSQHNLSRTNPRQRSLFEDVNGPREVRDA